MRKVKIFLFLGIIFTIGSFIVHNKAYYYGLSSGIFSEKLPDFVRPRFSGADLGNNGFYLIEKDVTVHVIDSRSEIKTLSGNKIQLKRINAYGFSEKDIILQITSIDDIIYFLNISYQDEKGYSYKQVDEIPRTYKYINLDKNLSYFKRFNLLKIFLMGITIILISFLVKLSIIQLKVKKIS